MAKLTTSDFYCVYCGNKGIPVIRQNGSQREKGHLKRLFCLTCQRETNHVEIRPFGKYNLEDFYLEYDNGNFDEQGNRKLTYGQLRAKLNKEGKLYREEDD